MIEQRQKKTIWNRRRIVILGIVLAALIFPFKVEIVPEWRVQVVDQNGTPISGVNVALDWQFFTIQTRLNEEQFISDSRGMIAFPKKEVWTTPGMIFFGVMRNILMFGTHASFERIAMVAAPNGNCPPASILYRKNQPIPRKLVLVREPNCK